MKKVLAWIITKTKLGKSVVLPAQKTISGYKSYLAGLAIAIPGLIAMIQGFSEGGIAYLMGITHTDAFLAFMNGLAIMGIRAAITKAADPIKDPNHPEHDPNSPIQDALHH